MKIESLGDWKFKMTSPSGAVIVVQFGEGNIPYSDSLDGNTPMSAAELMAEGGQTNMLEGRSLTIKTPRACQWLDGWAAQPNKVWRGCVLHTWITDKGNASAIVEDHEGHIHVVPAEKIRMVK
jgi:hypothetical protein